MKKLISIFLSLVLMLGITVPASAAGIGPITTGPIETDAEKLARVQAEVLSGNISNDQDVIEVALEQYAQKVAYCRANGIEQDPNESLTITQIIESDASIASDDSVQEIAVTGLLMFDENGAQITAGYVSDTSGSDTVGILGGNIVATTTMTVRRLMDDSGLYFDTKVYKISTTFQNFSGYTADSLQHFYQLCDLNGEAAQSSSITTNPASSVPITFYPSTSYISKGAGESPYYLGQAKITESGSTYYNRITYSLVNYGFSYP